MLEKSLIVISLFVSLTMAIAIIITKIETKKIKFSMDIYVEIAKLIHQYEKFYKKSDGYEYLKEKMNQFSFIIENYNSFPYEYITVKETNILGNVEIIEKMIDERNLALKRGLPDLYKRIGEINSKIYKVYNPVKHFTSEIKCIIFSWIIKLLVEILKGIFKLKIKIKPKTKSKTKPQPKPKDLTNLRSDELLSANVKLNLN